jgi:hypothetical protein
LATSMGLAYFAEAYSTARPQRRAARYLADVTPKKAWWEIGGNEPGLDLNVTPAEAPRWRPDPEHFPPKTSVPLPPFRVPYGFRAEADAIDPPADVSLSTITRGDTTEVDVTIVPKMESLSAVFLLPPGIEPTQTNLVGLRPGADPTISWRARFVGIPSTGIAFRATVPTSLADRLAETAVVLTGSRLPGADQPRWPMWLPQDRAVWAMSTQWIIHPPVRASVEPVPSPSAPPTVPLPGAALPSPTLPPPTSMPPR